MAIISYPFYYLSCPPYTWACFQVNIPEDLSTPRLPNSFSPWSLWLYLNLLLLHPTQLFLHTLAPDILFVSLFRALSMPVDFHFLNPFIPSGLFLTSGNLLNIVLDCLSYLFLLCVLFLTLPKRSTFQSSLLTQKNYQKLFANQMTELWENTFLSFTTSYFHFYL